MKRQQNSSTRRTARSSRAFPITVGILCALILISIAGWFFWQRSSPSERKSSFAESLQEATHPHSDQHKPSAGKAATSPQTTTQQAAPGNSAPAALKADPALSPSAAPETSAAPVTSPSLPEQTYHAERKGMRNGCKSGELSLSATALTFVCSDDTTRNVTLLMTDVKGQDDDGVESLHHEKYHFKVEGRSKDATRLLFTEWLAVSHSPVRP